MSIYKTKKRRFWEEHLEQWKQSGLSQVEYCRIRDVNVKSFRYWKQRVGRLGNAPVLVELPPFKSVPACASQTFAQLCLIVDRRYRIEIGKGFDSEDLERVVRVLGRI
jgi:hypothetical protein